MLNSTAARKYCLVSTSSHINAKVQCGWISADISYTFLCTSREIGCK